jgi:hypothetical protein
MARAGLAARRMSVGGDQRRPIVHLGVRVRQLALLAEHQRVLVEARGAGEVVARVGRHARESPRVRADQLGVRVDTSFSGGVHTPPISPVMCQPLA